MAVECSNAVIGDAAILEETVDCSAAEDAFNAVLNEYTRGTLKSSVHCTIGNSLRVTDGACEKTADVLNSGRYSSLTFSLCTQMLKALPCLAKRGGCVIARVTVAWLSTMRCAVCAVR